MRGISRVAENLLASQEGLCSIEFSFKVEYIGILQFNYFCFYFSTKEEQRHARDSNWIIRQRGCKGKRSRTYICGNVNITPICVCVRT